MTHAFLQESYQLFCVFGECTKRANSQLYNNIHKNDKKSAYLLKTY